MEQNQSEEILAVDREDLLAVLSLRFGAVPQEVKQEIDTIDTSDKLERLILAAANVPSWEIFLDEFTHGKDAFKITGEIYNPLSKDSTGR
ncbi:MAG TPA: hypothetical protein VFK44_02240 [Bacillales bacterium]|nr:hypothetical protein [Bacillales bacterium]